MMTYGNIWEILVLNKRGREERGSAFYWNSPLINRRHSSRGFFFLFHCHWQERIMHQRLQILPKNLRSVETGPTRIHSLQYIVISLTENTLHPYISLKYIPVSTWLTSALNPWSCIFYRPVNNICEIHYMDGCVQLIPFCVRNINW